MQEKYFLNCLKQITRLFNYGWDKALIQPEDYSKSAAGLYILR